MKLDYVELGLSGGDSGQCLFDGVGFGGEEVVAVAGGCDEGYAFGDYEGLEVGRDEARW